MESRALRVLITACGLIPIALQIPAGGVVDEVRGKRGLTAAAIVTIASGALLLSWRASTAYVLSAQAVLAMAGLFLGPALNAITLGVAGARGFDRQLGRNQSFAAAGSVLTALLMAGISYWIGIRNVFLFAAILVNYMAEPLCGMHAGPKEGGRAQGHAC